MTALTWIVRLNTAHDADLLYTHHPTLLDDAYKAVAFTLLFSLSLLRYILHPSGLFFFFLNDTATPEISTLPLHDALPISGRAGAKGMIEGEERRFRRLEGPPAGLAAIGLGEPAPSSADNLHNAAPAAFAERRLHGVHEEIGRAHV